MAWCPRGRYTHHSSYPLATTSGRRNSSNDGGPRAVAPSWDRKRLRLLPGDRPGLGAEETQYSSPLSSILEIHEGSRSQRVSPEASFQKKVSPVEFSTSSCQRCSFRIEGDCAAQAEARAKASSRPRAAESSLSWDCLIGFWRFFTSDSTAEAKADFSGDFWAVRPSQQAHGEKRSFLMVRTRNIT